MSKNRTHAVALGSHDLFWEVKGKASFFLPTHSGCAREAGVRAEQRSESCHDFLIARSCDGESYEVARLGGELLVSSSCIAW